MLKKMNILAGIFVASLFASVHAATHVIPYNTRYEVNLADGDELLLKDFPDGWGYSNVYLGVNAAERGKLSGVSLTNDQCIHDLSGDYQEIIYSHNGEKRIKYSGVPQKLPIHWWVNNAQSVTPCSRNAELSPKDSVKEAYRHIVDSVITEALSKYINLDTLNKVYTFEGTGGKFRVSNLPSYTYNMIKILVIADDGLPLSGATFSGAKIARFPDESAGKSSVVLGLQKRGPYDPTFEIDFPETRKIRLQWWVSTEIPTKEEIYARTTSDADSVEKEYYFDGNPKSVNFNKVKLKYAKSSFTDGKAPVVKKLAFMPAEARMLVDQGAFVGPVYDVHAEPANGELITVALPLANPKAKPKFVAHFLASENRWEKLPVDSISNGFAYFRTSSFSFFLFDWAEDLWDLVTDAAEWLWDTGYHTVSSIGSLVVECVTSPLHCPEEMAEFTFDQFKYFVEQTGELIYIVVDGVTTMALDIVDDAFNLYGMLTKLICGDFSPVTNFFTAKMSPSWVIPQGTLDLYSLRKARVNSTTTYEQWIGALANQPLIEINGADSYPEKWKKTADNFDIVLADLVYSQLVNKPRRYSFQMIVEGSSGLILKDKVLGTTVPFSRYFESKDDLLVKMKTFVDAIKKVYNVTDVDGILMTNVEQTWGYISSGNYTETCKEFLGGLGMVDWAHDAIDVSLMAAQGTAYEIQTLLTGEWDFNPFSDVFADRDTWLENMSKTMARVSLLAWLDKSEFRALSSVAYASVYDGMRTWLELASPIYGYNNLSILANASLALYEFVHYGTDDNLKDLNKGLSRHYGTSGEYSEGTGYSQYIWDMVPYMISALQQAYHDVGREPFIDWGFLNSGAHMADISRPVLNLGYIPVEIDDGCTYNPDYLVWSSIYSRIGRVNDAVKLAALAGKYPPYDPSKLKAIIAVGVPPMGDYENAYTNYDAHLQSPLSVRTTVGSDVGMLTVIANNDTVALSMIAENGPIWQNGQGHDQQDNLSVTLTSAKKGFLIMDRGYAGFAERKDDNKNHFSAHIDHNVLTEPAVSTQNCTASGATFAERTQCINEYVESRNTLITRQEFALKAKEFGQDRPGLLWSYVAPGIIDLAHKFGANMDDLLTSGGSPANFTFGRNDVTDAVPVASISALHEVPVIRMLSGIPVSTSVLSDKRTIMYFDGNVWIIDRPNKQGTVWMANSAYGTWNSTGMKLYGSENDPLFAASDVAGVLSGHIQNGSRPDYITPDQVAWFKEQAPVLQGVLLDAAACDKPQNFMYWYTMQDDNATTYVMNYKVGSVDFAKVQDQYCPAGYQCFENADGSSRMVVPPQAGSFGFNGYDLKYAFKEINTTVKNAIVTAAAVVGKRFGPGEWIFKSVDDYMYINGFPTRTVKVHPSYIEYEVIANGTSVFVPYSLIDNAYLPAVPLLLL